MNLCRKKLTLLAVAMAMLFSLTIVSAASPDDTFQVTFEDGSTASQQQFQLEEGLATGGADIQMEVIENTSQARDTNIPPVAALQYLVMNPETMVNGQLTTQTQVAWLWSYNGQDFTYDPDGDAIVETNLGGIGNEDVLGMLEGGIGFVTQFAAPGQYQMTFQVVDARGGVSNMLKITISVEAADGNNRPVCNIVYAPADGIVLEGNPFVMSWKYCTDPDPGDTIQQLQGRVYKNGSDNWTDLLSYHEEIDGTTGAIMLTHAGTYDIWVSVADNKGAWSDWFIFTIKVKAVREPSVTVNTYFDGDVKPGDPALYVDYWQSIELAKTSLSPDAIVEQVGLKSYPASLPKVQLSPDLRISGTLRYSDGAPAAMQSVSITLPLTAGRGLDVTVTTDAQGNFSYSLDHSTYWEAAGYPKPPRPLYFYWGDYFGMETQYAHYSEEGMLFFYPTTLTVEAGGRSWSQEVAATAGITRTKLIGNRYEMKNNQWQPFLTS